MPRVINQSNGNRCDAKRDSIELSYVLAILALLKHNPTLDTTRIFTAGRHWAGSKIRVGSNMATLLRYMRLSNKCGRGAVVGVWGTTQVALIAALATPLP